MNRRSFLTGVLAAATAPAFVRSESLMGLWVPKEPRIILWGDGIHDDSPAIQAALDGKTVYNWDGSIFHTQYGHVSLPAGDFSLKKEIVVSLGGGISGSGYGVTNLIPDPSFFKHNNCCVSSSR